MTAPQSTVRGLVKQTPELRVLLGGACPERLSPLAEVVTALGHEPLEIRPDLPGLSAASRSAQPDISVAWIAPTVGGVAATITQIVADVVGTVVVVLDADLACHFRDAVKAGAFGCIIDTGDAQVADTLDLALRRFVEFRSLEGAFVRRALIERAKGILMARNGVDELRAFELLRSQSQRTGCKLVEVAEALTTTHHLL